MADPAPTSAGPPAASARSRFAGSTPGWIAKVLLVGLADAVAIVGLTTSFDHKAWGYFTVLAGAFVALNVVFLPRRFVPLKYLVPGVFFLVVFALYPVIYTVVSSTTNYGSGHVLSKAQAVAQIQSQSVTAIEGSAAYDATPMKGEDGGFAGFALYDADSDSLLLGTADEVVELDVADAEITTLVTTGRSFVDTAVGPDGNELSGVKAGQARSLQGYPNLSTFSMPDPQGANPLVIDGGQAKQTASTKEYDPESDTITDTVTAAVYEADDGFFVNPQGDRLTPGFTANVGFSNFSEVLTSEEFRGPFVRVLVWNFAFAIASVITTFGAGLFLAMTFNELRMKSRKIYRSLLIIPYALPAFMTALVWKAMLNRTYGINRWLDIDVGWLTERPLAMLSLIVVNTWLGYPYMFLVSTGALQSIPTELKEAALVDGATGLKAFRKVTFPLLLVSVSPLLVASFAFNFNNFTLVWLVTTGGPRGVNESAGATDILLSWTYRVALDANPQRQGVAATISVMIFLIVAVISAIGFKYTKAYEEAR